ncbi:Crp/Fnr family transcriptional regulator [Elizabethkingia sp. JS20170427COW]|uniref:Crp/Fnr family transcriptional regulator n=1 Tax=Elizabethkingia sp. JS20170427COW TaxID=2583851 RepID=UPI0011102A12|nr:Crp/Fnr family transcriptional regulator [Elizabethkingia sp. JS20170427COW]QCX53859.1 Crp/Fnr family transcriptional regulator [Elizabethkingia sp. JS20170427COW]
MTFEINETFLEQTQAEVKVFKEGEIIIEEGAKSPYFFYLLKGELSVYNSTAEGKVFLQNRITRNNFFGEPAVLLNKPFPGYVGVISEKAEVLRIERNRFLTFLMETPQWLMNFAKSVASKSLKKSNLLKSIVFYSPEDRIIQHFEEYKRNLGVSEKTLIDLTRKELSTMTGLRIETIIRNIKKLEKDGKLEIIHGKVYY